MKNILFFLIFFGFRVFAQSSSWERDCVGAWNFEDSAEPYRSSIQRGEISVSTPVKVTDGIVQLPLGAELKSPFFETNSKERTHWMRFQIPPSNGRLKEVELLNDGIVQIKAVVTTDPKGKEVFNLKTISGSKSTNPQPNFQIPTGLWVQIALTLNTNSKGESFYKVYFYPEYSSVSNNDAKRNFWTYVGHLVVNENRTTRLSVGKKEFRISGNVILVDEIRSYSRKAELQDLYTFLPVTSNFSSFSAQVPGVVIEYSPAFTGRFVAGSPSVIVLDDGSYLAKGDHYGPAVGESELVTVFQSKDKGKTWKQISEIEGMTWASLFHINGIVYMIGTSAGHRKGHAIIIKSLDKGVTWSKPIDGNTGMILSDLSYHTAPTPVVIHNGKVWKAMEDEKGVGGWGTNFRAFMLSADLNSDLLKAESWTVSDILSSDQSWEGGTFKGWLEGNAVLSPEGNIVNVLRLSIAGGGGKAAIISYDSKGEKASFDPSKDVIEFPGGSTKFFIEYDQKSKRYWALSNAVHPKHNGAAYSESLIRNSLVLMSSSDLRKWRIEETILYHPETAVHAFQYPTFALEGEDMLLVSRTAYDDAQGGAFKHHDVNYFTFHRVKDFRNPALRKIE